MEEGGDKNAAQDFIAVQQLRFVRILKHKVVLEKDNDAWELAKNAVMECIAAQNVGFARRGNHLHGNVAGKEDCAMKNENVVPLWFALPLILTARAANSHQERELARKGHQNQNVVKEAVNAAMNKNVVGV